MRQVWFREERYWYPQVSSRSLTSLVLASVVSAAVVGTAAFGQADHEGRDRNGHVVNPTQFHAAAPKAAPTEPGESPAVPVHVDQTQIDAGTLGLGALEEAGRNIFLAKFNSLDGAGRPMTDGVGNPRPAINPAFLFARSVGPDTAHCYGCHHQGGAGGSGDRVENLFLGFSDAAQTPIASSNPASLSIDPQYSNERNPPSLFGDGLIEMLSREISNDLIAIRTAATAQAESTDKPVTMALTSKGISFGTITVMPNGQVNPSGIVGIDWDLVIKPFGRKGGLDIRSFIVGGMNLHFGIQPVERFGLNTDPDGDGISNELSVGDITAAVIFVAGLPTPGTVTSTNPTVAAGAARGATLFNQINCSACHISSLTLNNPVFSEPSPFNTEGLLRLTANAPDGTGSLTTHPFTFNMATSGELPRPQAGPNGSVIVRAFTDFKRHNITQADSGGVRFSTLANEQVPGASLAGNANPSSFTIAAPLLATNEFLTAKLWGIESSAPYGHRGDLTTLTDIINVHGGEALAARNAFFALSKSDQASVIWFLKSLRNLPDGSALNVTGD